MKTEEYDELIADPFKCIVNRILPRVYEALDPANGSSSVSLVRAMNIQNDMNTPILMEAARVSQKYGLPLTGGGLVEAPMDYIADMIRGFSAMTMDIRRQPKKVAAAAEAVMPLMDRLAAQLPAVPGKLVSMPLHMPVFMREKDFAKLWWPSFKALVERMAARGQYMRIYFELKTISARITFRQLKIPPLTMALIIFSHQAWQCLMRDRNVGRLKPGCL